MKKILTLFLAVVIAFVAVDLNAMKTPGAASTPPVATPMGDLSDGVMGCLNQDHESSIKSDLSSLKEYLKAEREFFEELKKNKNDNKKDGGKPGIVAEALISTFSGIVSYTAKYLIIIATIYLAAGYLNVPAVQVFLKDLIEVASFGFGRAFASATTTVATGAVSGIANYTINNPVAAAETAGLLSVVYWGPAAVATAGVTALSWMKLRIFGR